MKSFTIGTKVKIKNCFFNNWIDLEGKITAILSNPLRYKLDIGGEWLHSDIEKC